MRTFDAMMLLGLFLCFTNHPLSAQDFKVLNAPKGYAPLVVVIVESDKEADIEKLIHARTEKTLTFILVQDSLKVSAVQEKLNQLLNRSNFRVDKQCVNLILVGSSKLFHNYQYLHNTFWSNQYFLQTDSTQLASSLFEIHPYSESNFLKLIPLLANKRLWGLELKEIEERGKKVLIETSTKNRGMGLNFNLNYPLSDESVYYPNQITGYGLQFHKFFAPNWRFKTKFELGLNMPNPQDMMQDILASQGLDFSAILSGNPIEISIDETINGHIFGSLSVEGNYFFRPDKKFSPYIGLGGSYNFLQTFAIDLDTTLTIDPSSIFSGGSSPFGSGSTGFDPDNIDSANRNNFNSFAIPMTLGMQYILNDRWSLDFSVQYQQNLNIFNDNKLKMNLLSFQTGVIFNFQEIRKKVVYDYFGNRP